MDIAGFDIPISNPFSGGIGGWLGGGGWLTMILVILVTITTGAVVFYVIWTWRAYKFKVVVFYPIGGGKTSWRRVYDRARIVKMGSGGEEIIYLRKHKCYRSSYHRQIFPNEYWFAVGPDGYWYPFLMGDLDTKMGILDIEPIDRDMRYMHVAIRRNIQERYNKQKFMDKYGTWLMGGITILILAGLIIYNTSQQKDISNANARTVEQVGKVVEKIGDLLVSTENICTGGRGIQPAGDSGGG